MRSRRVSSHRRVFSLLIPTFLMLLVAGLGMARAERGVVLSEAGAARLAYDIAMNGATFHFEGPTNEAGYPADGTPFIVRGYLYPEGTFATHGSSSGTNEDGSPEFPELVVGTWYCRGWHTQDGDALTGVVVATTQVFDLDPNQPGAHTVVTDGLELADFDVWFSRAITGGSGRHRHPTGQQRQVYVDFNASDGFNTSRSG
ncbi:MAG TPA: hypothetical protein VNB06_22625 [Thermoanaerobaculia bacterium]|nr:hypothetical protein [Thermoanaerobaculia bacterium]